MVCPMQNKRSQVEASLEYPYQSLYRPWSWILSSSTNLFLFAAIVGIVYMLYKRRKAKGKRPLVTYRQVEMNKALLESGDSAKINVLVTGGSGMLGKEIVHCLLKDGGYKVHSLDLLLPEEENRNSEVCSYIQADITNFDDLRIATRGMDVVFHTAALLPTVIRASKTDFDEVNLKGTENVITACKECKVKRLIYTSTADVVISKGLTGVENTDEDHPLPKEPLNAYVGAKGRAEKAILEANDDDSLTTCALRPGGILELIVNPKLDHLVYVGEKGRPLPLVACEDLAQMHLCVDKALNKKSVAAGKAFNLCCTISECELDETIAAEKGDGQTSEALSMLLYTLLTYVNVVGYWLTGVAPISPLMTFMALDILKLKYHSYSCSRAHKELGWKPTPWKDTVKKLVGKWKESKKDK